MTEPSLAVQTLIHARLIADPAVTALVPAASISDRSTRPTAFPCIVIGDGTANYSDRFDTFHEQVSADIHVWTRELGLVEAKAIVGAIRIALREAPWTVAGHVCHGISVGSARFLRDPSGDHGHAVIGIDAVLQERAV